MSHQNVYWEATCWSFYNETHLNFDMRHCHTPFLFQFYHIHQRRYMSHRHHLCQNHHYIHKWNYLSRDSRWTSFNSKSPENPIPLVLVHCAFESQLWSPLLHSSMSWQVIALSEFSLSKRFSNFRPKAKLRYRVKNFFKIFPPVASFANTCRNQLGPL